MGRIRTIKPEIGTHELLYRLERQTGLPIRFCWGMLFTQCDREGRFLWRPTILKLAIVPYDNLDFSDVLTAFHEAGFIQKYSHGGELYGVIPTWRKHQSINGREMTSRLPGPEDSGSSLIQPKAALFLDDALPLFATESTREARVTSHVGHAPQGEGKGREGNGREGITGNARDASTNEQPQPMLEEVFLTFPCQGKRRNWHLTPTILNEWQEAYPGLDILDECQKALQWIKANKPKTSAGMPRFLVNWFNRAVERARPAQAVGRNGKPYDYAAPPGGSRYAPIPPRGKT
jgi:hypothetical protein